MKSSEIDMSDVLSRKLTEQARPIGRLLIIGYGNPLRGDDSIGWQIADRLGHLARESTKIMALHQLTPELAEPISQADFVIFIDARHDGQPGSWTCETIRPDPNLSDAFTHYFTPMKLLSYAGALFGTYPEALLISVAGCSFDCGAELSPRAAAIVPEIVDCVWEWWSANAERNPRLNKFI